MRKKNNDRPLPCSFSDCRHAALPEAVAKTSTDQVSGWTVAGDRERIKYNQKGLSDVYRIEPAKGQERKQVFINTAGTVLRQVKKPPGLSRAVVFLPISASKTSNQP